MIQLLPKFAVPGGRHILGLPLIALGGVIAFNSYYRWEASQRALRLGEPLPQSRLLPVLALGIGTAAVVAAVLAAFLAG